MYETPVKNHTAQAMPHPLDPLTVQEIEAVVQIARSERGLSESVRFASVNLHEPAKETVLAFEPGTQVAREAELILLDNSDGMAYEAIISLTEGRIVSWKQVPGVQPSIMLDEFFECEQLLKSDPAYQAALRKRGITNFELVMVDPWSAGNYGAEEEQNRRLTRALSWVRSDPNDNGYAHPIEGVLALVDLNKMEVVRIEDHGVVPLPPQPGNYTPEAVGQIRTDLKPLEITQPEGPSFSVNGHEVRWQKWHLHVGFTTREGLVLHTVGYEDQGRIRPVLYRAALAEMVVPYGDPTITHNRKNAFDVGEYGIGTLANALELGCDCLGVIHYFDAVVSDSRGRVVCLPNVICLHEEDYGILWKHVDWRTNQAEVRRSRRLVVSFIATVGNYEYGFFWYFYQDGTIQFEIKLTGIINTGALPPGAKPKYGQLVAPQLYAPIHQHIFNVRMDMMVDGLRNSVYEVHTEAEPQGPGNPNGNAYYSKATLLAREAQAQQVIDPFSARCWKIVNPHSLNGLGEPVAYKLMPGENTLPFAHPEASVMKRAGFTRKHLWVTPYQPDERYPAGDYPNQHPGGAGLPAWTQANRSIEDTDIVIWYTLNAHHTPRPEDWPVMPVGYIGFMLKPVGFFDRNPALDVPPPAPHGDCCEHQ
ncbi:primary-amine oxidase [Ktedonosporobacter rubrisoli]|uniref:Amine oxidase n=2 Tax=Ktedonosporobacter rubrisoli TaxID=2509675 RepID=A0A4P6K6D8_KTERU|nr:primary-amine oxidase [Ktedonosporobacter rubrisoli]